MEEERGGPEPAGVTPRGRRNLVMVSQGPLLLGLHGRGSRLK
jgi:hypothetical protein